MITPTIGRRVWFRPSVSDLDYMAQLDPSQAFDAGVIYVHDDRLVSLDITDHKGIKHTRAACVLLQDEDTPPEVGSYAEWMPYQKTAK